jgi:hypothetical protein
MDQTKLRVGPSPPDRIFVRSEKGGFMRRVFAASAVAVMMLAGSLFALPRRAQPLEPRGPARRASPGRLATRR